MRASCVVVVTLLGLGCPVTAPPNPCPIGAPCEPLPPGGCPGGCLAGDVCQRGICLHDEGTSCTATLGGCASGLSCEEDASCGRSCTAPVDLGGACFSDATCGNEHACATPLYCDVTSDDGVVHTGACADACGTDADCGGARTCRADGACECTIASACVDASKVCGGTSCTLDCQAPASLGADCWTADDTARDCDVELFAPCGSGLECGDVVLNDAVHLELRCAPPGDVGAPCIREDAVVLRGRSRPLLDDGCVAGLVCDAATNTCASP